MDTQHTVPLPLRRMFEHLDVNIEHSFQRMPNQMKNAMHTCEVCDKFCRCDYDTESRYFRCPNRDFLDILEET